VSVGDNMIRTQISLESDVYEEAKIHAAENGISLAEFCRQSVTEQLVKYRKAGAIARFAGIYMGDADDSSSVDEVVYGKRFV
jgi:hypothetical protein